MTLPDSSVQRPPAGRSPSNDVEAHKSTAAGLMPLLLPVGVSLPAARRLVVLMPDMDLDEAGLAWRVWSLAAPNSLAVLYLGSARSETEEPRARRRLATIAALTRDERVMVKTMLALEANWLGALRPVLRSGDVIVCHAEQTLWSWRGARLLGSGLCQALQSPVHLLSGFYRKAPAPAAHLAAAILFWGGAVAILTSAFWLQVQISALPPNGAESALLLLSVVAECGLIGLWNRAFS